MNLTVQYADTNFVQQLWPKVKPFIKEALDKEGIKKEEYIAEWKRQGKEQRAANKTS